MPEVDLAVRIVSEVLTLATLGAGVRWVVRISWKLLRSLATIFKIGNVGDMRFEGGEIVLCLAAQRHHREDGNREAEAGGIEIGVIAADHTRFLQRADAAQAGRRGEADAFGELDVGHAPILLQMSEDLTIDPIERHCVSHS
jgi:hypothetical protein